MRSAPTGASARAVDACLNRCAARALLAATVALGQYGADAKEALPTLREFAGEFKDKKAPEMQTIQAAHPGADAWIIS